MTNLAAVPGPPVSAAAPTQQAYLLVDGENIDATLGGNILGRRPEPDQRTRWDYVSRFLTEHTNSPVRPLFFLNASNGHLPMSFVQALMAMEYIPIPLAGDVEEKVVDIGIQRTLKALAKREPGHVILASHDGDFVPQLREILAAGWKASVICFREFLAVSLRELQSLGLEVLDLEYDVHAFDATLPRLQIISLEEFDPVTFLDS